MEVKSFREGERGVVKAERKREGEEMNGGGERRSVGVGGDGEAAFLTAQLQNGTRKKLI